MLAISAFHAIKDAVASVTDYAGPVRLDAPATPEAVLRAVEAQKAQAAASERPVATAVPASG